MGRHDTGQAQIDQAAEWNQVIVFQCRQGAGIDRGVQVRVGGDEAMAGKVFAHGAHAGLMQTQNQAVAQFCHRLRGTVQGAIANDLAGTVIEVQYRGETEIDACGTQLGAQYIAGVMGQMPGLARVLGPERAQRAHGRDWRETGAKALHPAAFVIDPDQQRRKTQGVNLAAQIGELLRVFVIAGKQDHPADHLVAQPASVGIVECRAFDIQHQGAERLA